MAKEGFTKEPVVDMLSVRSDEDGEPLFNKKKLYKEFVLRDAEKV